MIFSRKHFLRNAFARRLAALFVASIQVAGSLTFAQIATMQPASAATFACNAGKDGAAGTLSGTYNSYYAPTFDLAANATSIPIGTGTAPDTAGGGSTTRIAAGDLLLIIQMQDGSFTYSNNSTYGSGASIGNAGVYEYVQVSNVTTTTTTIVGGGSGGGLINGYTEAAATSSSGQKTYQIVVVPQYTTATLSSTFHAAYWDGKTGGVAALDVASTLNLNGASIYATGDGFRGGGVSVASTSPSSVLNDDYVDSATMNGTNPSSSPPAMGFKGEGIFGTPGYTFGYTSFTNPASPSSPTINKATSGNGYPGGDMAMGPPGNAGGGGTDADPVANDQNTGGGGGSNGGAGGNGGYPWTPNEPDYPQNSPGANAAANYAAADATHNPDTGGRGASAVATGTRALMGGGGGAGSNNNGSNNNPSNAYGSSGGVGGGIVMLRIADTSGSPATIYANGTTGLAPDNDGGGGGGAGGTVIITSPSAFTGITVQAKGAQGTTAYYTTSDTSLTTAHGPGGGGGGGAVYSSSPVSADVSGGANGVTVYGQGIAYGATAGSAGVVGTIADDTVPGAPSGASCYSSGTSGTATLYNGPYDSAESTYEGADYTGTYDGNVAPSNDNDFTAAGIPLDSAVGNTGNTSAIVGSPVGGTFTFGTAPTIAVPHELYYQNAAKKKAAFHTVTLTAQAPVVPGAWKVQICPSNAAGTAPNCSLVTTNRCSKAADENAWVQVSNTAGNTDTAEYCTYTSNSTSALVTYWTIYTPSSGTYTAFQRYDAITNASDDQSTPAANATHTELYAGYVVLTKSFSVVSSGCPPGEKPAYANGVCPGGILRYAIDFRSIVAGAGPTATYGTEGDVAAVFPITASGALTIVDDGTQTTASSSSEANWATFSHGLKEALYNNLGSNNALCGDGLDHCGASLPGSTFLYYTGIPASGSGSATFSTSPPKTKFQVTSGGSSFSLYPPNFPNQTSQGSITFAVVVK